MTGKNVSPLAIITVLIVALGVGLVIGWAAFSSETEVTKDVTKEIPMTLPSLAQAIRAGEIDVGEEYGLGLDQRYHNIHATVLGMGCNTCHSQVADTELDVFSGQDVSPQSPGVVDRRGCLGCHGSQTLRPLYAADDGQ